MQMSPTPDHAQALHRPPRSPDRCHTEAYAAYPVSKTMFPQNSPHIPAPCPVQSDARSIHESAVPVATSPVPHPIAARDTVEPSAAPRTPAPLAPRSPADEALRSAHTLCSDTVPQTNSDTTASVSSPPRTHAPQIPRRSSSASDESPRLPCYRTIAHSGRSAYSPPPASPLPPPSTSRRSCAAIRNSVPSKPQKDRSRMANSTPPPPLAHPPIALAGSEPAPKPSQSLRPAGHIAQRLPASGSAWPRIPTRHWPARVLPVPATRLPTPPTPARSAFPTSVHARLQSVPRHDSRLAPLPSPAPNPQSASSQLRAPEGDRQFYSFPICIDAHRMHATLEAI